MGVSCRGLIMEHLLRFALLLLLCHLSQAADDNLNFLVVGDWGGKPSYPYYTPAEKEIAAVMGDKAKEIGSQFTWALGDNFYDSGVKNVDDKRFKETYEVGYVLLIEYGSLPCKLC